MDARALSACMGRALAGHCARCDPRQPVASVGRALADRHASCCLLPLPLTTIRGHLWPASDTLDGHSLPLLRVSGHPWPAQQITPLSVFTHTRNVAPTWFACPPKWMPNTMASSNMSRSCSALPVTPLLYSSFVHDGSCALLSLCSHCVLILPLLLHCSHHASGTRLLAVNNMSGTQPLLSRLMVTFVVCCVHLLTHAPNFGLLSCCLPHGLFFPALQICRLG